MDLEVFWKYKLISVWITWTWTSMFFYSRFFCLMHYFIKASSLIFPLLDLFWYLLPIHWSVLVIKHPCKQWWSQMRQVGANLTNWYYVSTNLEQTLVLQIHCKSWNLIVAILWCCNKRRAGVRKYIYQKFSGSYCARS